MEAERVEIRPRRDRIKTLTEKTHETVWKGAPVTPEQYLGAYAHTFDSLEEGFQNTFEEARQTNRRLSEIRSILYSSLLTEDRESLISELEGLYKKCNELNEIPMNVTSSVIGGVYPRQVNLLLEKDRLFNQGKIDQALKEGRDFFLTPSELPDDQRQPNEFYKTANALIWAYSQADDDVLLASNLTNLNKVSRALGDLGYCGRLTLEILGELKKHVSENEYERLFLKLPHKLAFNNDNLQVFYAGKSLEELEGDAVNVLKEFTEQPDSMEVTRTHFEDFMGRERSNNVVTVMTALCSSYVGLRRSGRTPEEAVVDLHANAVRLGHLTERASDNLPSMLWINHPLDSIVLYDNLPEITCKESGEPIILHPTLPLHDKVGINQFSHASLEKFNRWRKKGGRCPMRHRVTIPPGDDNHITQLLDTVEKEYDVRPYVIDEQNQLHPGALNFTIGTMMAEMQGLFPALERFVPE